MLGRQTCRRTTEREGAERSVFACGRDIVPRSWVGGSFAKIVVKRCPDRFGILRPRNLPWSEGECPWRAFGDKLRVTFDVENPQLAIAPGGKSRRVAVEM